MDVLREAASLSKRNSIQIKSQFHNHLSTYTLGLVLAMRTKSALSTIFVKHLHRYVPVTMYPTEQDFPNFTQICMIF
jgi:hypothetical protein